MFQITDAANNNIRYINVSSGYAGTLAGSLQTGYMDGVKTESKFNSPHGVAVSLDGDRLFVADYGNHR